MTVSDSGAAADAPPSYNAAAGKRGDGPPFESIYLRLALDLSRRSTCRRLRVGTVITSTDFRRVLAIGYNGNAAGLPNDCDREEPGRCGCLHSEENAAIHCDAPRELAKAVFVTHLPCPACAKRLINLGGVESVTYIETYRERDSVGMLEASGIRVLHRQPGPETEVPG